MARGGYRKGAGRPRGAKDITPRMLPPTVQGDNTEQIGFRCSPEQRRKLEHHADKQGVTVADVLRTLINQL